MRRHGKDTLYFRADTFTFIVQGATIVTVEISDKNKRRLNKIKSNSQLHKLSNKKDNIKNNAAELNIENDKVIKKNVEDIKSIKVSAYCRDATGKIKTINLGTYQHTAPVEDFLKLIKSKTFAEYIGQKINEKIKPEFHWESVFVKNKNNGK